jgi:phosphorylcholine metabolism protein LicD
MREAELALLLASTSLTEANVSHHVDYGTLLGLARGGELIAWDRDVDLCVDSEDVAQVRRALQPFEERGWRIRAVTNQVADRAWSAGSVSCLKLDRPAQWGGGYRHVMDIVVHYRDSERCLWACWDLVFSAPAHHFDGAEGVLFRGRRLPAPRQYDEYLSLIYGDWRTPSPEYDARRDDGSQVWEVGEGRPVAALVH